MKTLKFSQLAVWASLCTILAIVSCQNNEATIGLQTPITSPNAKDMSATDKDVLRTEFAKTLAKALTNEVLREFLRNEAVQKFDGDHDIFFRKVKNNKVDNTHTLNELIAKSAVYPTGKYDDIINNLPLLNILVPTLRKASAESWNPKADIPWVAVMNSRSWSKEETKLVAYDSDGNEHILDKMKEPDKLVLVVQDSERITAEKKTGTNARLSSNDYLFADNENYYYSPFFQQNNKPKTNDKVRTNSFPPGPSSTPYTFAYFQYRDCERDILYKNVSNASYNSQYPYSAADVREKLQSIQFSSDASLANAADGWTEQTLEIRFTLFYAAIQPARVESSVSGTFASINDLSYGDGTTKKYDLGGIDLIHWDKNQMGDQIKITVIEYDNGTTTTQTFSFGTKFGSTVNVGLPVPGVTITGSSSTEFNLSSTVQVVTTNNSEVLGDANFGFCEDVMLYDAGFNNGYIKLSIWPAVPGYY